MEGEMGKPLTEAQLNALQTERDNVMLVPMNYRGLIARGLLRCRWGVRSDMGYIITPSGKKALIDAGR